MGVGCTASVPRDLRYPARSVPSQDHPTSSYGLESAEPQSTSLLATLRRRALIVVVTVLLVGGAAAAIGFLKGDVYQSTSKLLFSQTIGPELNATGLLPTSLDADNLAQDNIAAVDSHNVARATARRLGDGTSVDDLQKDVTVTGTTKDDIVSVTASSSSPQRAARVSTAWANAGVDAVERQAMRRAQEVLDNLNAQLAGLSPKASEGREGDRLRALAERVRVLADTGTGGATVIQSGVVPTTKSGNPVRTIVLGLLFGLVLGVGLALLREQADSRLHRPDEVSAAFDAPVLTTVPRHRALKRHVPFPDLPPEVAEAYRMLQANLRYGRGDRVRTVLVTSARSQEGKTTTSWYLAAAAASAGLSVALVEADLRRPTIAARYGLRPDYGLVEVLRGELTVAEALQPVAGQLDDAVGPDRRPGVQVLVAGDVPADPFALLQSDWIGELLEVLKQRHDFVVVDTPPLPHVADAIGLLRHVEGVLVTASVNSTRGFDARRLRDQLQELDARVLGVVANGGTVEGGYGYAPTGPAVPVADPRL